MMILCLNKIKTALIFGSFASKKEGEKSDMDLMIIGNPDITKLNNKISLLENKLKKFMENPNKESS